MLIFSIIRNPNEASNRNTLFFLSFYLASSFSFAGQWARFGDAAQPVTQDNGDTGIAFSFTVGTTTPVKVYTADVRDREILFQNTDPTFYVHCGTWSAVNATAGTPRFLLPPKPTGVSTQATYSIWCLGDPSAGSTTIEVVGIKERASRDAP